MHYLKEKVLDGSSKRLKGNSCAADSYLSLSDLIKLIEETMIASVNHKDMEFSRSGLKLASQAG